MINIPGFFDYRLSPWSSSKDEMATKALKIGVALYSKKDK